MNSIIRIIAINNSIKVVEDIELIYKYHTDPQNQTLDASRQRFASYDFCHSYFLRNRESLSFKMEESCIYLWSFLGSWGMLRGSSVLLKENSPASLRNVVECIAKTPKEVWDIDVEQYVNEKCKKQIIELYDSIKLALKEGSSHVDCKGNPITPLENPSRTLVTKIMMGVFGIVPAFDTFFSDVFDSLYPGKGFRSGKFSHDCLDAIYNFYLQNKQQLDSIKIAVIDFDGKPIEGMYYKKAKLIDMYGFTRGVFEAGKDTTMKE